MSPISSTLANASAYGYRTFAAGGATAYESIASATGTGSSGTITFSSIPSTYKHLQIRAITRCTLAGVAQEDIQVRVNGDTGTNYSYHNFQNASTFVNGASATQMTLAQGVVLSAGHTANFVTPVIIDVQDYASTTKNKTFKSFAGIRNPDIANVQIGSGAWLSTSAINSITLLLQSSNWTTTTQFALYGIKG